MVQPELANAADANTQRLSETMPTPIAFLIWSPS
jgi:hypothetical protein